MLRRFVLIFTPVRKDAKQLSYFMLIYGSQMYVEYNHMYNYILFYLIFMARYKLYTILLLYASYCNIVY